MLISNLLFWKHLYLFNLNIRIFTRASRTLAGIDFNSSTVILAGNNTPPASLHAFGLECSAPRGVTRFWGAEK